MGPCAVVTNPRFMRLWQSLKEKQHEVWALCGAFSNPMGFSWWCIFDGTTSQLGNTPKWLAGYILQGPGTSVATFFVDSTSNRQIRRMLGTCVTLGISVCQCFFCFPSVFLFKLRGNFCPWPWLEFSLNYLKHVSFICIVLCNWPHK